MNSTYTRLDLYFHSLFLCVCSIYLLAMGKMKPSKYSSKTWRDPQSHHVAMQ